MYDLSTHKILNQGCSCSFAYEEMQNWLRRQVEQTPEGEWIRLPRADITRIREGRFPTSEELNEAAPDHPAVFVWQFGDRQVHILNSAALKAAGITGETTAPEGGHIQRDEAGEPTGRLVNSGVLTERFLRDREYTDEEFLDGLERLLNRYTELGITSIFERSNHEEGLEFYEQLKNEARLPVRAIVTRHLNDLDGSVEQTEAAIRELSRQYGEGDEHLRTGPLHFRVDGGDTPVRDKAELLEQLEQAVAGAQSFCEERGVDLDRIISSQGFELAKYQDEFARKIVEYTELCERVEDSVDRVLINDEYKQQFLAHARVVDNLYKAVLPDPEAGKYMEVRAALKAIADRIRVLSPTSSKDISEVRRQVEDVLDASIASKSYTIDEVADYDVVDLSRIDFEKLKERFAKSSRKRVDTEKLKTSLEEKIDKMVEQNRTRMDFRERFEELIEKYNNYSINLEVQFEELVRLAQDLTEEEQRHVRENLNEEELALFDLVVKESGVELSESDKNKIKKGVRELLSTLQAEKFVIDWKKHQSSRAQVKVTIEKELDEVLPDSFGRAEYAQTCNRLFDHVVQKY